MGSPTNHYSDDVSPTSTPVGHAASPATTAKVDESSLTGSSRHSHTRLQLQTALHEDTISSDTNDVEPLSLPTVISPVLPETLESKLLQRSPPILSPVRFSVNTSPEFASATKPERPTQIRLPSQKFIPPTGALTVSAVLSRSGQFHPLPTTRATFEDDKHKRRSYFDLSRRNSTDRPENVQQYDKEDEQADEFAWKTLLSTLPESIQELWRESTTSASGKQGKKKAGQHHTGSALEAIGALFLQQDTGGRLDELSLNRSWTGAASSPWDWQTWLGRLPLKYILSLLSYIYAAIVSFVIYLMTFASSLSGMNSPSLSQSDELPETPVMMPGGYFHDPNQFPMLPPPLIDDEGSDPRSFEGLLGVRRMREQQQRRQQYEALVKRNRPAHRVDAFTAFINFVRSAKATQVRHKAYRIPRRRFTASRDPNTQVWTWGKSREKPSGTPAKQEQAPSYELPKQPAQDDMDSAVESSPLGYVSDSEVPSSRVQSYNVPSSPMEELDLAMSVPNLELPRPSSAQAFAAGDSQPLLHRRITPQEILSRSTSAHTSPDKPPSSSAVSPASNLSSNEATLSYVWVGVSVVFACVTFLPDFCVFLMAHLLDLVMDTFEVLSYTVWFLLWIWQNITGQTILGQIVYEAYHLVQKEWEHVIREDHEEASEHMVRFLGIPLFRQPRGLSTWQVLRGLIEIICIQTVTREQYQKEGAGLVRLQNWRRHETSTSSQKEEGQSESKDPKAGVASESYGSNEEESDDDDDDDLVVTDQTVDVLELSRNTKPQTEEQVPSKPHRNYPYEMWHETNGAMVRNIKWASQLSMSAYGLRVLIVDLPPIFTPSGQELPKQTFAHLTRLQADDVLHADIQNLDMEATYLPTFYIVRDMRRKVVCVAVRGTQSFADIVVDLDMKTEDVTSSLAEWRDTEVDEKTERFAYHAGIWRAAKTLVEPGSVLFKKVCDALNENEDFGLVFVGHSLGAAIASAAVIQLSEYHIEDTGPNADPRKGVWRTSGQTGYPAGRLIRAITFAHPSTLSHTLSKRVSYGRVPLVINVTYATDLIPRFGHGQVREIRRVLGALTRVRRRRKMVSTTISSHPTYANEDDEIRLHVIRRFWDWWSIQRNKSPDQVMLARKKLLEKQFWRLRLEVESDLYTNARRRFEEAAAEKMHETQTPMSPWVPEDHYKAMPLHTMSGRRQRLDYATVQSESRQGGVLVPGGRSLWLNDGEFYDITNPLAFFSLPDLHFAMFTDHFPAAYEEAVLALDSTST